MSISFQLANHVDFSAFCLVGGFLSYHFLRDLLYRYYKFETNHPPLDEGVGTKTLLLWKYNTIIAGFGVVLTLLYSIFVSSLFVSYTLETLVAVAILFSAGNIIVRISSYGYTRRGDLKYDEDIVMDIKERLHDAIFSFIVGIWFILFIGLGLHIFHDRELPENLFPSGGLDDVLIYSLSIVSTTFILSLLCIIILWAWPLSVPQVLRDAYE